MKRTRAGDPASTFVRRPLAGGRAVFLGSFPGRVPPTGLPEVAFAGRSNVGKSSAINRLVGTRRAARVSRTPGRTRQVNLIEVEGRMVFVDLPGYGFARVPDSVRLQWKSMVEGYIGQRPELRLVVVLLDCRREPQEMDGELIWAMRQARVPLLVLATKADKLKRRALDSAVARLRDAFGLDRRSCIPFSSLTGLGLERALAAIDVAVEAR